MKVKREVVDFLRDEHIRHEVDAAGMAKLPTIFKQDGGTVTAGNASGMNDAGAALVLMSDEKAAELGAPVRARVLAYASCGVDPEVMGIGPVPAVRKVLDRSGVALDDIGVIELNEAFAAQALAVIKDLDLDPARVNPNGGAIALGPSDRRDGRRDHHEVPVGDGSRGPPVRPRDALHRRRAGHRHAARQGVRQAVSAKGRGGR